MAKFIVKDYQQSVLVPVCYPDQLQSGTFEWALHYLIEEKLDLSVFYPRYRNDETGRPAYDPKILLKIVLFAYSKGITSSREIQWCCQTNILFKALSCDSVPHYTTIAEFVSGRGEAIEAIFEQILLICEEQGLLGNELFAIDGCKLSSNASKEGSGTFAELANKRRRIQRQIRAHLKAHQDQDQRESQSCDSNQRREQAIESLDRASERIDQFLKAQRPRMGQGKRVKEVKSNLTDNESAKMTTSKGTIQGYNGIAAVDKKHQVIVDAQAFGDGQEHHTLQPLTEKIRERYRRLGMSADIYAEGAVVTADTGFANEANMRYLYEQGINAYIPDNQFRSRDPRFSEQKAKYGKRHPGAKQSRPALIPAESFAFDPVKRTCRCPAGEYLRDRGERDDPYGNRKHFFEGRLRQCRDCRLNHQCMKNPASAGHGKGNGRQVSFILSRNRKPNYTDWMKHRVDSPRGKEIYSHRMSVVEPVFGNITINKKLNRFSLRGRAKVNGQWKLYCLVHNIEKLANYGQLAA